MILPKAALDDQEACQLIVSNQTTDGNVTSFEYEERCDTTPASTATTFYKTISMLTRIFYIYMLVYIVWLAFINFTKLGKKVIDKMGKNGGKE